MSEAIEAAKRITAAVRKCEHEHATWYELTGEDFIGLKDPYEVATELLRLAEPEWGEPTADGWYWVEGLDHPLQITHSACGHYWNMDGIGALLGLRVAPCVGRPRKAGE